MTQATNNDVFDGYNENEIPLEQIGEQMRAEVEAIDLGAIEAKSDEEKTVYKYMRRRQQILLEAQRLKDQMQAMLKSLMSQAEGLDYVYKGHAEKYAKEALKQKRTKSIKTPFGTLGFRTKSACLEIVDDAALQKVALVSDDPKLASVLVQTWVTSKSNLNEYFAGTGDVPEGVELKPEQEVFFVR